MADNNILDRDYRFINPEEINPGTEEPEGTNAECLADSLLDIIQIALVHGMEVSEVEEALEIIQDTLAKSQRSRFKLHSKDE